MRKKSKFCVTGRAPKQLYLWAGFLLVGSSVLLAQETLPIGKTKIDQERNTQLLSGYDYQKYPAALTGYTGKNRQHVAFWQWQDAMRIRVGPRGNTRVDLLSSPTANWCSRFAGTILKRINPKGNSAFLSMSPTT